MALGRKRGGLDLRGVNQGKFNLPGGNPKKQSGLTLKPRQGVFTSRTAPGAAVEPPKSGIPRRSLFTVGLVVVVALVLAVIVGAVVYQMTVRNAVKAEIDQSALASVLTSRETIDDPYWFVMMKSTASSAEAGRGEVENLALGHVDPESKTLDMLWIPANTRVYIDGYGYRTINDSFTLQTETGLINAIKKLSGVSIAHYMEFNQAGLGRLEDNLGSLELDSGTADANAVTKAIASKVLGSSSEQIATQAEYFEACTTTDMDADAFITVFQNLQGIDMEADYRSVSMPLDTSKEVGEEYSIVDLDAWNTMVARVGSGMAPTATKKELGDYEAMRENNVITIWNGIGVSGVASDCSDHLKKLGWEIESVGNAAQFVYSETLVVYKYDSSEEVAELLVSDLGQGRVVRSAARYSFEGDVLVVIGQDYQPY